MNKPTTLFYGRKMPITVSEAGKLGGLTVLQNRGRDFFVKIGRKGQKVMRAKYPDRAREWRKLGGRPRKPHFKDMGRE